jgi:hypothetical protein
MADSDLRAMIKSRIHLTRGSRVHPIENLRHLTRKLKLQKGGEGLLESSATRKTLEAIDSLSAAPNRVLGVSMDIGLWGRGEK